METEVVEGVASANDPITDDDFDHTGNRFEDDTVNTREGIWEGERKTFKEEMDVHIKMIGDFADGLQYQVSFQDRRFLKTLQKEGVGFFRLAENVSVVNADSIQAGKHRQQRGRAQLQTQCFFKHAHEQMKHNQIKLRFLVTYIAPTHYIQ